MYEGYPPEDSVRAPGATPAVWMEMRVGRRIIQKIHLIRAWTHTRKVLGVGRGLEMILSHMAPSLLNMKSY